MNLLSKIQGKITGRANPARPTKKSMGALDKLPDAEKAKVLDYLTSAKKIVK